LLEETGSAPGPLDQEIYERALAVRGELDEEQLQPARSEGRAMSLSEAVDYAQANVG
jgi:hypothetical protein